MKGTNETSQECSQNMSEDIEQESTVGEFIVLLGPSHQDDSDNGDNSSQSLSPQGSTDRRTSSPPCKTHKKKAR